MIGRIGETDNELKLKLKKEPIRPSGAGDCWNDGVEQREEWKKLDLFNLFVLE